MTRVSWCGIVLLEVGALLEALTLGTHHPLFWGPQLLLAAIAVWGAL